MSKQIERRQQRTLPSSRDMMDKSTLGKQTTHNDDAQIQLGSCLRFTLRRVSSTRYVHHQPFVTQNKQQKLVGVSENDHRRKSKRKSSQKKKSTNNKQ
jgi:hypothetical protein